MRKIAFSPPHITEDDITAVCEVLRSGWITSGPVGEEFCEALCKGEGGARAFALNSATGGLFLALKAFGVGQGDEVITTPYTFAATANVICHTGARVVFADTLPDSFFISPASIQSKMSPRTKAVIPVDFGGGLADYSAIKAILGAAPFRASNPLQGALGRPLLLADSAHSLGVPSPHPDVRAYSFHAVKNLTTAEGGALLLSPSLGPAFAEEYAAAIKLLALHGQDRSARDKYLGGSWQYDIILPGYKFNMPDILAALGLSQLRRYRSEILPRRRALFQTYARALDEPRFIRPNLGEGHSAHLFPLRLEGCGVEQRDAVIAAMGDRGIACNVHYRPLTLMGAAPFYGDETCPNAEAQWPSEISLPIHGAMGPEDALYVAETLKNIFKA